MNALNSQIGGDHYKNMASQPIHLIHALECSFIQGCIIKYISRYKSKNKAEDIKKCMHYAQLAIELNSIKQCHEDAEDALARIYRYAARNDFSLYQRDIILQAVFNEYEQVIQSCKDLLQSEYPESV